MKIPKIERDSKDIGILRNAETEQRIDIPPYMKIHNHGSISLYWKIAKTANSNEAKNLNLLAFIITFCISVPHSQMLPLILHMLLSFPLP